MNLFMRAITGRLTEIFGIDRLVASALGLIGCRRVRLFSRQSITKRL